MNRVAEPPHPGVYAPASFICMSAGPSPHTASHDCVVTFRARPHREIASVLLEEIGDWMRALRALPAGAAAPAGVVDAVTAAHDAVANWSDLIHARDTSARRRTREALDPSPPGAA